MELCAVIQRLISFIFVFSAIVYILNREHCSSEMKISAVVFNECILIVIAGHYRVSKEENGICTVQYSPEDYNYGPTLAPTVSPCELLDLNRWVNKTTDGKCDLY